MCPCLISHPPGNRPGRASLQATQCIAAHSAAPYIESVCIRIQWIGSRVDRGEQDACGHHIDLCDTALLGASGHWFEGKSLPLKGQRGFHVHIMSTSKRTQTWMGYLGVNSECECSWVGVIWGHYVGGGVSIKHMLSKYIYDACLYLHHKGQHV